MTMVLIAITFVTIAHAMAFHYHHHISKKTLLSVESVQLITENYRKVPSNTELYRKWTKKLAYKPYLKISLNLLCMQNKPFAYRV